MKIRYQKKYRSHVVVDLVLMMLVASHCFWLVPLRFFFDGDSYFFTYLILLAVIYIRNMGFEVRYGIAKSMMPLAWMLVGVLISFIPAYRYYGQHLYYSFIVYRPFFGYAALPLLLSIRPSHLEFKRGLYAFSLLYTVVMVYASFINQDIILFGEARDFIEEGDFVHMLEGCQFLPIAFIYSLNDLRTSKITLKNVLIAVGLFGLLFILQNRTIILASVLLALQAALSNKSASKRLTTEVLIGMIILAGGVLVYRYINGLISQTMDELSNPEYNRIKAFNYFVSGVNGTMSYIWGNGFISGNVNNLMEVLRKEGIFHSDLGLIGFWNQFGILAVGVIVTLVIRGLSRMRSYLVRGNALYILAGAMTISYFLQFSFSLWLCFFMYLFATDQEYKEAKAKRDAEIVRRAIRHYRSLTS